MSMDFLICGGFDRGFHITKENNKKKQAATSGSRTAAKKPQPRPIRREVGGVVCLVLALCVFVSYFGISAIFIDWLAVLLKGLLGYGYWLFGPALVLAGCILLFHHGRPVTLRVTSALLLPVLLGSLCHMLLVKEAYASSIGIIPALWKDGAALQLRRRDLRRAGAGVCGGIFQNRLGHYLYGAVCGAADGGAAAHRGGADRKAPGAAAVRV